VGPLDGIRIVELAGIGPAPHAGMLLSDLGAEVIRVDRTKGGTFGDWKERRFDVLGRGRRSIALDLKHPRGVEIVWRLVERADALIEGYRPGVAERLGVGPDACLERNPRLVYGRMTGWGQTGPLASAAGHDINYVALTGALHAIGAAGGPPTIPLNLVGDFGGGSLYLAFGVVCALLEAGRSGRGQVVDAAMVDGVSSLMAAIYGAHAVGFWSDRRGTNMLDGGAPFYQVYETKDGRHVAVGAIEPQFYQELIERIGIADAGLPGQHDQADWPKLAERLRETFLTKTRDEWCDLLEGTDVCFAPVLSLGEAPQHPHVRARSTFVDIDGVRQPAPAPRFSRSAPGPPKPPSVAGSETRSILSELGYADDEIERLGEAGVVAFAPS